MSFPSPASDYVERSLDLNEKFVKHPRSTFFMRASGDAMKMAGISEDDILIVDRSVKPATKAIVVANLDSELIVRRLVRNKDKVMLYPENENYSPIEITPARDFEICGVVTYVIHNARPRL